MSVLPPESPFWSGPPEVSGHAQRRWLQRTSGDRTIETGWQEGQRLPPRVCGEDADEMRVHTEEAVVLCRRNTGIVTVLDLKGEDAEQWLRSAVYSEVGAVWTDAVGHVGGERR